MNGARLLLSKLCSVSLHASVQLDALQLSPLDSPSTASWLLLAFLAQRLSQLMWQSQDLTWVCLPPKLVLL